MMETAMPTYITKSEQETEQLGMRFAEKLPGGAVVAMYGDLGAGKTAFVRGMARGLGLDCRVSSPTFTIVNEYLGKRELFISICTVFPARTSSLTSAGRTI